MINTKSIEHLKNYTKYRKPDYGSYAFSRIPGTFNRLLGFPEKFNALPADCTQDVVTDRVVVFFIDAMGWVFLERLLEENPILKNIYDNALVSKITSNFPSTTTNHVVAFSSGLTPGQTGLIEWQQYSKKLDQVIFPLPSIGLTPTGHEKLGDKMKWNELFPESQIMKDLKGNGVEIFNFKPQQTVSGLFSDSLRVSAHECGYQTLPLGLEALSSKVNETPGLYSFYYDKFDSALHEWGTSNNPPFHNLRYFFKQFEKLFLSKLNKKTSVIFVADHGQVSINPRTTVYLNDVYPEILSKLKFTASGMPIAPCGSARDVFLHVNPEFEAEVHEALSNKLSGVAEVVFVRDFIEQGYFGDASQTFLDNVGNILILPNKNDSVWFNHHPSFINKFFGHHGGLTPDEMETPFIHYVVER